MPSTMAPHAGPPTTTGREPSHVIGLGASAGGLAPLLAFMGAMGAGSDAAVIVVQHMAPGHPSALVELIGSHGRIPACEARDGQAIEAGQVYVIAPGTELRITEAGQFDVRAAHLTLLPHQVDLLFESMAQSLGPRAVGVIMSGLGNDGTAGLRDILDQGGVGAVQTPETADFDGMPRSAMALGDDVIVDLAENLPARIATALATPWQGAEVDPRQADSAPEARLGLMGILQQVAQATGRDFSQYKPSTLARRVARRMAIHSLGSMPDYARLLAENPQEADLLCKELLIGVTGFFRDPAVWEALGTQVLPDLIRRAAARPGATLRAWVAGCSTGEEAYTLGMLLLEAISAMPDGPRPKVLILATDLSADAIDAARRGQFPASIAQQVSAERLQRFFIHEADGSYRVNKHLRDLILFAMHDLTADAPFIRLDLLTCRNVLIYFKASLQARVLPLFQYALLPGGCLVLGNAETVNRFESSLPAIDSKLRLYRRSAEPLPNIAACFPLKATPMTPPGQDTAPGGTGAAIAAALQLQADRMLLDEFAPPAVLVNAEGDILYISGRTGRYLEPAAGKANWNIHAMAREGLRAAVSSALRTARNEGRPVSAPGLAVTSDTGLLTLDLSVRPLQLTGQGALWLVLFREHLASRTEPPARRRRPRTAEARDAELEQALAEVRSLREEMHASQEELQSANEELQSTNEELQSANEELTTSKEEMQAMNEELQTVNAELLAKLEDLAVTQSDLKNLLNSTQIATLFLDSDMNVRRFTEQAKAVINLRDTDVGRPLSDLTTILDYPALREDIAQVLRTLAFSEKSVRAADAHWYSVRIMPYRTQDNVIAGSVITFVDVTAAKNLEAQLRQGAPQGRPPAA